MKFKLDENLPRRARRMLDDAGHDAMTVPDEGLGGAEDDQVAATCLRESRVLITLDLGFADIRSYPPNEYPGIIVLRPKHENPAEILSSIRRLVSLLEAEPLRGRLWILEPDRLRIRGEADRDSPGS